jgi:bifunctional ADP-heptose synthase (sugar kinase/adenylyltransferase)
MTVPEILNGIGNLRVLIAGDICLDRWCRYDPRHAEPSRETGIPRIAVVSTEVTPGGGGTVANNVAALGAGRVAVLGVAGDDGNGYELAQALEARGIEAAELIRSRQIATFTYTKLIHAGSGVEDQPRVDFIHAEPLAKNLDGEILARLRRIESEFDVIIALDQSETPESGVITAAVRDLLSDLARANPSRLIWADSRIRAELFRDVTVKINRQEADLACRRAAGTDYRGLRGLMRAPRLFVTDGPAGVHWIHQDGGEVLPVRRVEKPVDICGAGDSFTAGASCALALGATDAEAAHFGGLIASITIMKPGTGTASPTEVLSAR